jgi:uncharacterized protein
MSLSIHAILVPSATRFLGTLDKILDKAAEFATRKEIEASVLLNSRLAPDMFPLTRQVQIACDMIKGGAARLSGNEVPSHEDTETTIPELKARIAKVLAFVNGIAPEKFTGGEDRDIVLKMRRGDLKLKGLDYLRDFVLPNFHFHLTTSYAILRHNGVEIGKQDYLGS